MPKNLHAGIFRWFWAVLPGQKILVCIFLKNKYGFQMLKIGWYSKTYTLLTSVHNDLDSADIADDYNMVIGISKCEQKIANTHPYKHPPTHTHRHVSWKITISSAYDWHILTNIPTHPHTHRHASWKITISSAYDWHILTNIPTHPHTHRHASWKITISSAYDWHILTNIPTYPHTHTGMRVGRLQ